MHRTGRSVSSNGVGDHSRDSTGRSHVVFRRATLDDAIEIVPLLRRRDILNLSHSGDPVSVITEALMRSVNPIVGTVNNQIVVMWGTSHVQLLDNRVYIWMLGTVLVDKHRMLFLRYSRDVIWMLRERYSTIYGEIEIDYYHSIKWLVWLGAKIFPNGERLVFVIGG